MRKKELELVLAPEVAFDAQQLEHEILKSANVNPEDIKFVHRVKRSVDARGREVLVRVRADIYLDNPPADVFSPRFQ